MWVNSIEAAEFRKWLCCGSGPFVACAVCSPSTRDLSVNSIRLIERRARPPASEKGVEVERCWYAALLTFNECRLKRRQSSLLPFQP
jgi:hypothetical protein